MVAGSQEVANGAHLSCVSKNIFQVTYFLLGVVPTTGGREMRYSCLPSGGSQSSWVGETEEIGTAADGEGHCEVAQSLVGTGKLGTVGSRRRQ